MSTLFTLFGVGVPIAVVAFAWCCFRVAKDSDDAMDRAWAQEQQRRADTWAEYCAARKERRV